MPNEFTHRFTQALSEALTQALPNTPSGSHKMLVVGQLVVNVQGQGQPSMGCPGPTTGVPCCGKCHK